MLNDKTLELNITHEILGICRRYDHNAFTLGTTLIQESYQGYDSRTLARLPQSWITSPLQYKRAKKRIRIRRNVFSYVFDINNNTYNDQQLILYHHLAGGTKNVAFYILPALFTNREFFSSLPALLTRTFLVDVADIKPFWVNKRKHSLEVFPHLRIALLHSGEERKIKTLSMEELGGLIAERKIGSSISVLRENLKLPLKEKWGTESQRPRFLFTFFPGSKGVSI